MTSLSKARCRCTLPEEEKSTVTPTENERLPAPGIRAVHLETK